MGNPTLPSKLKFDNKKVTQLLERYIKAPKHNEELRNRIVRKSLPLIEAALHRKHVPSELAEDIRQDCAVKILRNLHKYKKGRGSAFAFLWTVICNHIITQISRRASKNVSLTTSETASGELEVVQKDPLHAPESRYVLQRIDEALAKAFEVEGFHRQKGRKHRKAVKLLRTSVKDTTLFTQGVKILRKLRHLGLTHEEAKHYVDFTMIKVRHSLLHAREEASGITSGENQKNVPSFSTWRIPRDFREGEHD